MVLPNHSVVTYIHSLTDMVFVFEFSETARNFKSEFVLHGMIKEINVED